jgi:hypothetical protein
LEQKEKLEKSNFYVSIPIYIHIWLLINILYVISIAECLLYKCAHCHKEAKYLEREGIKTKKEIRKGLLKTKRTKQTSKLTHLPCYYNHFKEPGPKKLRDLKKIFVKSIIKIKCTENIHKNTENNHILKLHIKFYTEIIRN